MRYVSDSDISILVDGKTYNTPADLQQQVGWARRETVATRFLSEPKHQAP